MPEKSQENSPTKGGMKAPEENQTPASEGAGRYSGDTTGKESNPKEGQKASDESSSSQETQSR